MGTGGEVANALVCKTSIRGFDSRPVLQFLSISLKLRGVATLAVCAQVFARKSPCLLQ